MLTPLLPDQICAAPMTPVQLEVPMAARNDGAGVRERERPRVVCKQVQAYCACAVFWRERASLHVRLSYIGSYWPSTVSVMAEIEQDQPSMSEGGTSTADVSNGADSPCPESAADSSSQDLLNRSFTEAGVDLSEDIAAVKAERRDAREGYPSAQSPNGSSSEGTPGNQAAADSSSNGGRSAGRGTVVSDHVSSSTPASGDGCRGSGATAKSIYLDDGPEKKEAAQEPAPARRLTRVRGGRKRGTLAREAHGTRGNGCKREFENRHMRFGNSQ